MTSATWTALSDPHRRAMLALIGERPRVVGELTELLGLSQPGTSKHLRVLRDAGLVTARTEAQHRRYELSSEPLRELDEWLAPFRACWNDSLDALERRLDQRAQAEQPQTSEEEE